MNEKSSPTRWSGHLLVCCLAVALTGCDWDGGHKFSLQSGGEEVKIRLLTLGELQDPNGTFGWKPGEKPSNFDTEFEKRVKQAFGKERESEKDREKKEDNEKKENEEKPDQQPSMEMFGTGIVAVAADALVPVVVGVVIDAVDAMLEKEAGLYDGPFGETTVADDFWGDPNGSTPQLQFSAFELTREVKPKKNSTGKGGQGDPKELAFRFVGAIVPSRDGRFFLLKPLFLYTRYTKAKVHGQDGARFGTIIKVGIEANWIDHRLQRRRETIATANWLVKGCKLAERKPAYFFEKGQPNAGPVVAGWFTAPGPSYRDDDLDGRPDKLPASSGAGKPGAAPRNRAVPYRLTIRVTEADESKMKEFLEEARKLLAKQRDRLIKGAGELAKKAAEGN